MTSPVPIEIEAFLNQPSGFFRTVTVRRTHFLPAAPAIVTSLLASLASC